MEFLLQCITVLVLLNEVNGQCSSSNRRATETLTVTEEPQYITSPGYKTSYYSNMDCKWYLYAPVGKVVIIDVVESYFEGSPGCAYDYLGVYNGITISTSAVIKKLCNNMRFGELLVSSSQNVTLRMKTDFSVHYPGFTLRFFIGDDMSTACSSDSSSPTVLTAGAAVQYLTSPLFPAQYDTTQNCYWRIISPNNKVLRVEIILADMEGGEVCYSDKLQIYNGTDNTGNRLVETCDNYADFVDSEEYYTSGTTSAFISFETLESGRNRRGFLIAFNETDTVIAVPTTTPSYTYSTCGSESLTIANAATPVYVTSPDYPIFYSNNLDCYWLVTASQGSVIQIKVEDFYLEDSEACFGDYLVMYDGLSSSYSQIFLACGESSVAEVNTTGNSVYLAFRSDGSTNARGFKVKLSEISAGTPVCVESNTVELNATFDKQYFNSENYPSNYGSSASNKWLIYNTEGYDYEIVIQTIDSRIENSINCYADKVQLYKGPCTSYDSLGTFCGESEPTYTMSSGLYVLLVFTSDTTAEFRGFNISYYIQKTQPSGLSTLAILAIVLGSVFGFIALVIIGFLVYKFVIVKQLKRVGSLISLRSNSSSSSSSSSDSDVPYKRHGRLKPIKNPKVNLMAQKTKLPPIKKELM